jgi:serine/threonine protein kinase
MFSLEGGSLVGKGTYGCVFDPPLRCRTESPSVKKGKGKGNEKLLGKITLPEDFAVEAAAAKILKPLGLPYFLVGNEKSVCMPDLKQKEKNMGLCTPLEANPLHSMVHFTVPYGGKTFFSRLSDTNFLTRKDASFFNIMLQLLEAGSYLISSHFVHYDISMLNVLINEKGGVGLIDFGMSFSAEDINEDTIRGRLKIYNPEQIAEAPEMTIVSGIVSRAAPLEDLVSMTIDEKDIFSVAEKTLGLNKEDQKKELLHFWQTSHAAMNKDWVSLWKLYWPTFDSWGIGMCLTYLLRRLLFQKDFVNSPEWRQRGSVILFILRGMLQANPRKRLDAVEALKLYDPDNVWFEKHGTSWLTSRAEQRRAVSSSV